MNFCNGYTSLGLENVFSINILANSNKLQSSFSIIFLNNFLKISESWNSFSVKYSLSIISSSMKREIKILTIPGLLVESWCKIFANNF